MTQPFTVFGYWQDSDERYGQEFDAESAAHAERLMADQAEREGGQFRAAATLRGAHEAIDRYTAFTDPDDPRNDERDDLEPAIEELLVTEYTVIGLVVSTKPDDKAWNEETGGQRHLSHEMALSARIAEDVAAGRVRDGGGFRLLVCGVLEGRKERAESHVFSNPHRSAA